MLSCVVCTTLTCSWDICTRICVHVHAYMRVRACIYAPQHRMFNRRTYEHRTWIPPYARSPLIGRTSVRRVRGGEGGRRNSSSGERAPSTARAHQREGSGSAGRGMILTLVYWGCLCLDGVVYLSVGAFVSYGKSPSRRVCVGLEFCHRVQSVSVREDARMRGSDLRITENGGPPFASFFGLSFS